MKKKWLIFCEYFLTKWSCSINLEEADVFKFSKLLQLFYTVKLARAKLPAKAAGKLIRRWKYLRMQAKISAGTDCLRFLRVTGGNLPAPAGNSHEVFIIRVRADFFKPRAVFFSSSTKQFDQTNHWLPLKSMVNLSNLLLFQKRWSVLCWLFKPISKKTVRRKSLHYHQNDRELAVVT